MNPEIKPTTAALILFLFGALITAKFWAYGESIAVRAYSYMHRHPDGSTYIQLDNRLFGFDATGQPNKQIDLAELGVSPGNPSDFAFFSNGDILIRCSAEDDSLVHNLKRYLRLTNQSSEFSENKEKGFFRCSPENRHCSKFGVKTLNMDDAFAVEIDWQSDRVFLSDASRHRVYLYSENGRELDRIDSGLKFPNQIIFHEGDLYIANTNRHAITVVAAENDKFGNTKEIMSVLVKDFEQNDEIWPASFLLLDRRRWVVNSKNDMNHGGLYVYGDRGEFVKKLLLPEDADPFAIIRLGNRVLVSDYSNNRIYSFSSEGSRLKNFDPPKPMRDLLEILDAERNLYQNLDDFFSAAFIVALSVGFGIALNQARSSGSEIHSEPTSNIRISLDNPSIHWITVDKKFKRYIVIVFFIGLPLLMVVQLFPSFIVDHEIQFGQRSILISVIFGLFFVFGGYIFLKMCRARIGILGDLLILVDGSGHFAAGRDKQIRYSDNTILINDIFLNMGTQQKIFPVNELVRHVFPLLTGAEYVTNSQMQMLQLKKKKTFFAGLAATSTVLIAVLIYYFK
ncbi:MAG: hypothetical protein ACU833_10195 [Gammaproteobacteria bacterium]